ncbi:MAG: hypothetical protein QOJ24_4850, partial [Mycobacterium sp.]|nr:hypothetical protein [Mycobacterium sp.]
MATDKAQASQPTQLKITQVRGV